MGEAQQIINSLNIKIVPDVWHIEDNRRVIKTGFNHKQKVLLLLYNELNNKALIVNLFKWTEYSNISLFKKRVIEPLHQEKLIEYDSIKGEATISPLGIVFIEDLLTKNPQQG